MCVFVCVFVCLCVCVCTRALIYAHYSTAAVSHFSDSYAKIVMTQGLAWPLCKEDL